MIGMIARLKDLDPAPALAVLLLGAAPAVGDQAAECVAVKTQTYQLCAPYVVKAVSAMFGATHVNSEIDGAATAFQVFLIPLAPRRKELPEDEVRRQEMHTAGEQRHFIFASSGRGDDFDYEHLPDAMARGRITSRLFWESRMATPTKRMIDSFAVVDGHLLQVTTDCGAAKLRDECAVKNQIILDSIVFPGDA